MFFIADHSGIIFSLYKYKPVYGMIIAYNIIVLFYEINLHTCIIYYSFNSFYSKKKKEKRKKKKKKEKRN